MEPLRIGSNESNDWVIGKPPVSGTHARIYYGPADELIIEDLHSTNGTFVNGRRILKATLHENSKVKIADVPLDMKDIRQKLKIKSNDYTEEFAALESAYSRFKQEAQNLKRKNSTRMLIIRIVISLVPIIVLILVMDKIESYALRYSLFGISPIIFMVFSYFHENNPKSTEEFEALQEAFLMKYICPKCKAPLGGSSWKVLLNQKRCPRCSAIWAR